MGISEMADQMLTKIITAEFLESVERWARYDGKDFYIGDGNIIVENKGEFKMTKQFPKLIFGENGSLSLGENEDSHTFYDVTLIRSTSRCTNNNNIIIIAKKYPELLDTSDFMNEHPCDLFIYSVFNSDCDDSVYTKYPSFDRLKSDFEKDSNTQYNSLIRNFCGRYSLSTYNDQSDRIFGITAISSDLESLDCDEKSKKKVSHIVVSKRLNNVTDVERKKLILKLTKNK